MYIYWSRYGESPYIWEMMCWTWISLRISHLPSSLNLVFSTNQLPPCPPKTSGTQSDLKPHVPINQSFHLEIMSAQLRIWQLITKMKKIIIPVCPFGLIQMKCYITQLNQIFNPEGNAWSKMCIQDIDCLRSMWIRIRPTTMPFRWQYILGLMSSSYLPS